MIPDRTINTHVPTNMCNDTHRCTNTVISVIVTEGNKRTFSDHLNKTMNRLIHVDSLKNDRSEVPVLEGPDESDSDHHLTGHVRWRSPLVGLCCQTQTELTCEISLLLTIFFLGSCRLLLDVEEAAGIQRLAPPSAPECPMRLLFFSWPPPFRCRCLLT